MRQVLHYPDAPKLVLKPMLVRLLVVESIPLRIIVVRMLVFMRQPLANPSRRKKSGVNTLNAVHKM